MRDKHSGQIAFPGGKIENNETSLSAAMRETYEEIGLYLDPSTYLGHTGLSPAYQGGLRTSAMLLTSHIFFIDATPALRLNPGEVSSYRWVNFKTFTHDLLVYRKPKLNSHTHNRFKTWLNPSGCISGSFPGMILPKSSNCTSDDNTEYHLWGATYRKIREVVMLLPRELRKVKESDWVYYDLDWPNKVLNTKVRFIDSYLPHMLDTKHFII